ncbi:MAG: SIMPL domain-containing protein [bacterium]|nr:SIMPL domain-containing protein [bacterium]
MDARFPRYFFFGLLVLSLGLVAVGLFTAQAIRDARRSNDIVTVTGSARKTVQSDYATWGVNVWCLNPDTPPYDCTKNRGQRIVEFLKSHGVVDSDIVEGLIRVEQMFDRGGMKTGGSQFIGYQCVQRIEVHTTNVASLDKLVKDFSALIPELIELNSESPQYYFTKLADLRIELLGQATMDAKARAEMIAGSAGGKVSTLRNAKMGVFQITAPNSRDVRDYGSYDTSTLEKDVTAVVTASFAVE